LSVSARFLARRHAFEVPAAFGTVSPKDLEGSVLQSGTPGRYQSSAASLSAKRSIIAPLTSTQRDHGVETVAAGESDLHRRSASLQRTHAQRQTKPPGNYYIPKSQCPLKMRLPV
jgi:hypothetical protein